MNAFAGPPSEQLIPREVRHRDGFEESVDVRSGAYHLTTVDSELRTHQRAARGIDQPAAQHDLVRLEARIRSGLGFAPRGLEVNLSAEPRGGGAARRSQRFDFALDSADPARFACRTPALHPIGERSQKSIVPRIRSNHADALEPNRQLLGTDVALAPELSSVRIVEGPDTSEPATDQLANGWDRCPAHNATGLRNPDDLRLCGEDQVARQRIDARCWVDSEFVQRDPRSTFFRLDRQPAQVVSSERPSTSAAHRDEPLTRIQRLAPLELST
ncbi:MAG: hypothetical protein F9K16_01755 [Thermoanaerobaculia bacterium]|nr:MAG: hypothetical protein F9K16_01755 [Thermoanaerobaculia bacterium]MBZ0102666.1 hypothetical protein [Thermoanaerobaculia bacterium]